MPKSARSLAAELEAAYPLPRVTGGEHRLAQDPRRGFRHAGEFFQAVIRTGGGQPSDDRLKIDAAAPTTFGSEGSGADGGFAVPPAYAADIWTLLTAGDSLLPLCQQLETDGNSLVLPKDETTGWGSTGVIAAWQGEGIALTQLKPALGTEVLRLCKLMAFVALSDELLTDAPGLTTYLPKKAGDAISWRLNKAIVTGTGSGQPLGILNAPALITIAKDSGQSANTVTITNCTGMYARLPPGSHSRAVWLADLTTLPVLLSMGATASGYPMFVPSDDVIAGTNVPMVGRLLGRPVIATAATNALSAGGDLVLADLSYYRTLTKPQPIAQALSLDAFFDAHAAAMRFTCRFDGMPGLNAPLADPKGGSTKLSPFVTIASR